MSAKDQRCYLSKAKRFPESLLPAPRDTLFFLPTLRLQLPGACSLLSLHITSLFRFCSLTFWCVELDIAREQVSQHLTKTEGRLAWRWLGRVNQRRTSRRTTPGCGQEATVMLSPQQEKLAHIFLVMWYGKGMGRGLKSNQNGSAPAHALASWRARSGPKQTPGAEGRAECHTEKGRPPQTVLLPLFLLTVTV